MSQLLFGHDADISAWVAERIPHVRGGDFGPCAAIGVVGAGKLLAGIVYHQFSDYQNIQLSMAADSPMWARRSTIAALLHYPFRQLNCWMVYTLTPPENMVALRVNKHIGFKQKTIVPHAFGKKRHAVVCQMTEPEYVKLYEAPDGIEVA